MALLRQPPLICLSYCIALSGRAIMYNNSAKVSIFILYQRGKKGEPGKRKQFQGQEEI